ncbi:hypothetical protein [Bacillus kexueae]|uniref:hypothetical protein n=1 Tax=Aeribacillus kexueae TaxID=2078952 RepID=UPI001FAF2298
MAICSLCNGLKNVTRTCPQCQAEIFDKGKVTDYFDDYSAYMDIESMKLFDGFQHSIELHQCIHLFFCEYCMYEELYIVHERNES